MQKLATIILAALTFATANYSPFAICEGLFLLDTKSINAYIWRIGTGVEFIKDDFNFTAKISKNKAHLRYSDGWIATLERELYLAEIYAKRDYKFLTFDFYISKPYALNTKLTLHTKDSLFYAYTGIGRIKRKTNNIIWESENDSDMLHKIKGDETSVYVKKEFGVGVKNFFKVHSANMNVQLAYSEPRNSSDYYVRDSINFIATNLNYKFALNKHLFFATYSYANANANFFGIHKNENSKKRFMYLPAKANVHYLNAKYNYKDFGVNAHALIVDLDIKKDPKRFHESLAPIRIIPNTFLQVLSLSFFQKNYRISANAHAKYFAFGQEYAHKFKHITPKITLNGFYANALANIERVSETVKFASVNKKYETFHYSLKSIGLLPTLQASINIGAITFNAHASQIIPLYVDKEKDAKSQNNSNSTSAQKAKPFTNGFAASASLILNF